MDLICFGQQNWDYCWTGKQHLMTRLARRGHRVLYVDPQALQDVASLADHLRALAPVATGFAVREVAPGLSVFTHRHAPILGWRLNEARRPRVLRSLARRLGFQRPVALVLHPDARPFLRAVRPAATVYYAVDEMTAFGGMTEAERRRMRAAEEALLAEADLALCVSPRLLERFRRTQPRSYLLENGADVDHFAPARLARAPRHPAMAGLPSPRLVFVGQVDERLDQPLLVTLARARRDCAVVLAGRVKPGVDVSALAAEPNVHLIGYQPYEELPSVLAGADVCLVPYRLTDLTQSCNPLKVFEYLASGRPVVTTPLDGLGRTAGVVEVADTPERFVEAVGRALADPAAGREARLAVAAANGWEQRADELERRLEEAVAAASARTAGGARPRVRRRARRGGSGTPHGPHDADRLSWCGRLAFWAFTLAGHVYYALRVAARALRGEPHPAVRRILVARRCRLGDLVVALPALARLRAIYPRARIVLGVQRGMSAGALLEASPDVDEVRVLDFLARPTRAGRLAGALSLFLEGYDVVVSGASFFLLREAFFAGAPRRVGLDDGHPLQRLNSRTVALDPTRHEADNNLAVVETLGPSPHAAARPPLSLPPAAVQDGWRRVAAALRIGEDATLVVVHPGAQKPSRRWPVDRVGALVRRLLERRADLTVVLTGVPDEAPLVDAVLCALPPPLASRAASAVGLTDLPALVALLDRAAAVVCNDTGLLHLARARGAPLVALLGPENDRRWGPDPAGPGTAIAIRHEVPCAPCLRWDCAAQFCLRALGVDEVEAAVLALLDGERGRLPGFTRRATRWTWDRLDAAGFEVPLVSVLLAAADHGRAAAEALRAAGPALAAAMRQTYPRLEVVVAVDGVAEADRLLAALDGPGGVTARVVRSAAGAWRAALDASAGTLVAPLEPGVVWLPGKVGADVALLQRDPAVAASGCRLAGVSARRGPSLRPGTLTMRRDAFERLLSAGAPAPDWSRLPLAAVGRVDAPLARQTVAPAPRPWWRPRPVPLATRARPAAS